MKNLVFKITGIFLILFIIFNCQTIKIQSTDFWTVIASNESEVILNEENNILHAEILKKGNEIQYVEAKYNQEFILETGYKYKLSFDAWADKDKVILVDLLGNYTDDNEDNNISYLEDRISQFLISKQQQTFEFEFIMEDNTDNNSTLCFYLGDFLGDVYISNISLEQVGEEESEKPVVSVFKFINSEDTNYLNVICEAITDTILFNLNSIGKYEIIDNKNLLNTLDIDEIKQYATENKIDNIIFGRVYIDNNNIIQVAASVYDKMEEQVTISEMGSALNIFEVFDVSDALVLSLLEGFSNMHIAYGSINITNAGINDTISLYIDNKKIGEDIYAIEKVFIGAHNIKVIQESLDDMFILYSRNIKIEENIKTEISINIINRKMLYYDPEANEEVVIDILAYGFYPNYEADNWTRIVEAFEKENPNIDIQYEMHIDEAYHQKVTARLSSGDVPDMAYMGADALWGAPWKVSNQQFDHTPYIDADYYDLNIIPSMGPNGEIYEIPLGTSNITTVLFMNEALVNSLGYSTPKTYEDLVAMVPAAEEAGLDVISIDGADGWTWVYCLMSMIIARMSGETDWVSKAVAGQHKFTDQVFVDSLAFIAQMVADGVISDRSLLVDFDTNISNYNNRKALFMIQGQWAADAIENVADDTLILAWPELPGEKSATSGSVAANIKPGYGITAAGAEDPSVLFAALKFLKYFNSVEETSRRLRDGLIIAPILKNFNIPEGLPSMAMQKIVLAQNALNTDVIGAFLIGPPIDALKAGIKKIVAGTAAPEEIAEEVESLLNR